MKSLRPLKTEMEVGMLRILWAENTSSRCRVRPLSILAALKSSLTSEWTLQRTVKFENATHTIAYTWVTLTEWANRLTLVDHDRKTRVIEVDFTG